jgi:hypothetical protein
MRNYFVSRKSQWEQEKVNAEAQLEHELFGRGSEIQKEMKSRGFLFKTEKDQEDSKVE